MPDTGTLCAHVFTSRANLPLPDASVTVLQKSGTERNLLAFRETDESGNTAPFSLPAPPAANSRNPNQPQGYALVDLAVFCDGFEPVFVEDIPIFPGTVTLQDLQLLPQSALPDEDGEIQVFPLTQPDL